MSAFGSRSSSLFSPCMRLGLNPDKRRRLKPRQVRACPPPQQEAVTDPPDAIAGLLVETGRALVLCPARGACTERDGHQRQQTNPECGRHCSPLRISHQQCLSPDRHPSDFSQSRLGCQPKRTYHEQSSCSPPSSTPTSMPSTPRSSSCSTRRSAASRSRSAAAWCSPRPTRRRPSACAAACRAGGRASSART